MAPSDSTHGALIARYGKSRSFLLVWWLLALVFAAAGAFVLMLALSPPAGMRFSGDPALLHAVGAGGLLLGLLVAVVPWLLARSQPTYFLHERAVRCVSPQGDRTDRYADIEDLYVFQYGGFAYRADAKAPWCTAGGRISGLADLTQRLRGLHVQHRGERLFDGLQHGRPAVFRCLPDAIAASKSVVASRNMDHPTHLLELTSNELKVEGKSIAIGGIADIRQNDWLEKSTIVDAEGRVFHTMHPTAVLSFDVLYALLARLQQAGGTAKGA